MRLKKITISGFKSFADKTTLHFDEGITCIVGPNGCGKSNISDAFRWVLGEQSVKSLRGNKMQDVIFAGTSSRKPLNIAEVSLTLTDIQGTLPLDYEEVTIARRLYKTGESEYLLNGNPVRLKDLQGLFLDSGIGKNAFSIFEQGKLDQVIHFSPLERRYIFEEAAGILRFLQKKKEALKRLEEVKLNVDRLQDIDREIEQQVRVLEKQAEKAVVFKGKQKELEQLEKNGCVLRFHQLQKKERDLSTKRAKLQTHLHVLKEEGAVKEREAQEQKKILDGVEKEWQSQKEALIALKGQKDLEVRESELLDQQSIEMHHRTKKVKLLLEDLVLQKQTGEGSLKDLQRKREALEQEWNQTDSHLEGQKERLQQQEKTVLALRSDFHQAQKRYMAILQTYHDLQSQMKQTEIRLENHVEKEKQVIRKKEQLLADRAQTLQSIDTKKEQLQQISSVVDAYKERLDGMEESLKKEGKEIEQLKGERDGLKKKLLVSQARLQVLLKLKEDFEGFSSGTKLLLKESANEHSPLYNSLKPFYEFFDPKEENKTACAAILRHYAQTVVVKTVEDFQKVLSFAQEKGLHDFSLFCQEFAQKESKGVFEEIPFLDHFLSSIHHEVSCLDSLNKWKEKNTLGAWSQDGFYIDFRGVLFAVSLSDEQLFLRESEMKLLSEEVEQKEEELSLFEQSIQSKEQRKGVLSQERMEVDRLLRRDEMKLVEVNMLLQRGIGEQEKQKKEEFHLQEDLEKVRKEKEELQTYLNTLSERFSVAKEKMEQEKADELRIEKEWKNQETLLRLYAQEHQEKGKYYQEMVELRQKLSHESQLLEMQMRENEKNKERLEEELFELEEKKGLFQQKETEGKRRLSTIEDLLKTKEQEVHQTQSQLSIRRQAAEKTQIEWEKDQQLIRHQQQEELILSMQIEQQATSLQTLQKEAEEKYALSLEALQASPSFEGLSLEKIEKQAKEVRQFLETAGDVNLAAVEELEKQQRRHTSLKEQLSDVDVARQELEKIIDGLDEESRKIFQSTFDQIRTNFRKNFQILFNGGEADLELTDSEDLLKAGIEITAKPPGKQMRSMSLLSGGEKCLTAVALLFSIFEVRPAPFCILDEIDAPLDDTNVERFVNVVKHFVNRCQFLIITHNKRTMAIGDVLFGVSMEEKGVSKLLSMEFSKDTVVSSII